MSGRRSSKKVSSPSNLRSSLARGSSEPNPGQAAVVRSSSSTSRVAQSDALSTFDAAIGAGTDTWRMMSAETDDNDSPPMSSAEHITGHQGRPLSVLSSVLSTTGDPSRKRSYDASSASAALASRTVGNRAMIRSSSTSAVAATSATADAFRSTTTAVGVISSAMSFGGDQPPPPLAAGGAVLWIQPFVVRVPHLPGNPHSAEIMGLLHAATCTEEYFREKLFEYAHPVTILGRLEDDRQNFLELVVDLFRTRNACRTSPTPFYLSTQQFLLPNLLALAAMFGPNPNDRAEFLVAKKHIICAFCGSELSLRNNAKQYVDKDYSTHPHMHPTGLHSFLARILAESLWVWA